MIKVEVAHQYGREEEIIRSVLKVCATEDKKK